MTLRIVLLRGILRDHRHWNDWPQKLQQAIPRSVVETPDLAGNGARNNAASGTNMRAMVDDLKSQISPLQCGDQLVLVTISMGAMIACQWAQSYPDEVTGIVMMNSSLRRFSGFYHRLRPAAYCSALRVAIAATPVQRERWVLRWTSLRHSEDKALAQLWSNYASAAKPTLLNSLRQLRAAASYRGPVRPPCDNIVILSGAADQLVSPQCSLAIARAWHCRQVTHPQAGHDLPLDQPDWVVRKVVDFVAQLQSKD
ncbi:hypothetical protein GCM10011369_31850 [Neiella marina]|uniref:AB hydrolase-1 domain-containing protein n=1 Tax=Neiella marina TaxID=508461 RepID=A0A8J2XRM1_9GAMM|nr:alpha/beta hydrolase [Neiella marina]GGA87422.1 hypothetical protein GCM10011369_31850 [Neiella marina]